MKKVATYFPFLNSISSNKLVLLVAVALMAMVKNVYSQEAVFSQFYASSLYLNPSFAGLQPDISLSGNFRVQWRNINPYTTTQLSLIYPFLNKNRVNDMHWGGVGLSVFQDDASNVNTIVSKGANLSFAYKLNLGVTRTNFISFGLQAGFAQQRINFDNFQWGTSYTQGVNEIDATSGVAPNQVIYPTVAGGIFWYYAPNKDSYSNTFKIFAGVSGYHLNRPNRAFFEKDFAQKAPILFKAHGGFNIPVSAKIYVSPNAIFAMQNGLTQTNVGGYVAFILSDKESGFFAHPEFLLGGWYRVKDAVIFNTGLTTDRFSIGLSYDLNNSGLNQFTTVLGAYEISLALKLPRGIKLNRYATPRI